MLQQLLHNLLLQNQRQSRVPPAEPWKGQDYDVQESPFAGRVGLEGVLNNIQGQRDEYWNKKDEFKNRFGNNPDMIREKLRRYLLSKQYEDLNKWNQAMRAGQQKEI